MAFFGNRRKDFSIQFPRQSTANGILTVTDNANIDFTYLNFNLTANLTQTGVTAGTYGDATHIPVLQIDQWGRVTGVTTTTFSASGVELKTNYTINPTQTVLNLINGTDISIVDDTLGNVTISYIGTGGSGAWGSIAAGTGVGSQTDLVTYLNLNYYPLSTNPAGYLTTISGLNISLLTNDSGYITSSALTGYVPNTRTLTINGTTYDLSADRSWTITTGVTGSGVATRVAFWDAVNSLSSNADLYWDNVNSRLGIGNTSPITQIDLGGTTGSAGTISKIALYSSGFGTYGFGVSPAQLDYISGGSHVFYRNSPSSLELFRIDNSGNVTSNSLAGTGTRMVVADSGGVLSTQTIPSGTSPLTTKGDLYTYSTADTRLALGLNTQVLTVDTSTATGLKWGTNTTPPASGYYGAFSDITNQTAAAINTGYPMLLGVTDLTNGVTVVSNSRVTIANTGIYNIQWSAQFTNPTAAEHDVTIWLRKNGTDVPGSAGIVLVPAKHGSSDGHTLPSWNFLLDPIAGDYYEFVWSTVNTSVYISFQAAGSPPPSTASVVLTVTQQAGIMAGTGITAINSLTGAVQTLASTDLNISSSVATHTFSIANNAVTYAKMQAVSATSKLLGSSSTTTPVQEITVGSGLTLTGTTLTASSSVTPAALTKVDDTNVTLTLGGTPSTALLQATSITAGWTGTLADARIASATTWNAKQSAITLTTLGTSGAATFAANTLNIPQYASGGAGALYKSTVDTAGFLSTSNTAVYTQLIPANTYGVGDVLRVNYRSRKTGTAGIQTLRIYVNATPDLLVTPILVGQYRGVAVNTIFQMIRHLVIKSSTANTEVLSSATTVSTTDYAQDVPSTLVIDWTAAKYFVFALQNSSALDTNYGSMFMIEKL